MSFKHDDPFVKDLSQVLWSVIDYSEDVEDRIGAFISFSEILDHHAPLRKI